MRRKPDLSITKDFDGKTLNHLLTLPEDIKFITEDGNGVMNNAVMARAFAIATERGLTIMSHAEDREISPGTTAWPRTSKPCATAIWPSTTAPAAHVPRLHQGIRRCRPHEPDARCAGQLRGHAAPPVV